MLPTESAIRCTRLGNSVFQEKNGGGLLLATAQLPASNRSIGCAGGADFNWGGNQKSSSPASDCFCDAFLRGVPGHFPFHSYVLDVACSETHGFQAADWGDAKNQGPVARGSLNGGQMYQQVANSCSISRQAVCRAAREREGVLPRRLVPWFSLPSFSLTPVCRKP